MKEFRRTCVFFSFSARKTKAYKTFFLSITLQPFIQKVLFSLFYTDGLPLLCRRLGLFPPSCGHLPSEAAAAIKGEDSLGYGLETGGPRPPIPPSKRSRERKLLTRSVRATPTNSTTATGYRRGEKGLLLSAQISRKKGRSGKRGFLSSSFSFGPICWAEERDSGAKAEGAASFLHTHHPHFHSPRARSNCCPNSVVRENRGEVLLLMDGWTGCCSDRRFPFSSPLEIS